MAYKAVYRCIAYAMLQYIFLTGFPPIYVRDDVFMLNIVKIKCNGTTKFQ